MHPAPSTQHPAPSTQHLFGLRCRLELLVTPDMAGEFLSRQIPTQRHPDALQVTALCREMVAGRWITSMSRIMFDENGALANGQHQLRAAQKFGKPVLFTVETMRTEQEIALVDSATRARTVGTQLHIMRGTANAARRVAIAGKIDMLASGVQTVSFSVGAYDEVQAEYGNHIDWAIHYWTLLGGACAVGPLAWARAVLPLQVDGFAEAWSTGIDLQAGSSILALKSFWDRARKRRQQSEVDRWLRVLGVLCAFRAYVDDIPMKILRPTDVGYRFVKAHSGIE